MKAIKILQCSDPMFWYRDKVGHVVPLIREYEDEYLSREPAGYTNIVKKCDSTIIEIVDETVPLNDQGFIEFTNRRGDKI